MISTDIHALNTIAKGKPNAQIGATLMTTNPYPLYYRMITKCGCTYIMNVLHLLNYGKKNPDPFAVHDQKHIIPVADMTSNRDIIDSPYSFVVIRDPVKRFMSLYFDKLYGSPRKSEKFSLGEYFINTGLIEPNIGDDIQKHRKNCLRSILWIKQNLAGKTDQKTNWHWKPQRFRLNQIHPFRFNVLLLDDINYQLCKILTPLVPNISTILSEVSAQNISPKPLKPSDILDKDLIQIITDTYPDDTKIYHEVSNYWRDFKKNNNG